MIERLNFAEGSKYSATEASIHLARYLAVKPFVKGKRVLDVACGEGYGSYLIKTWGAGQVYGVDRDEKTVLTAKRLFNEEGLDYLKADATDLPFEDYSFDVIVSFETIEHLDEPAGLLWEIKRLLKPGGTVLLSCPNDYYYYENASIENPFHKHKYHFHDFRKLAEEYLGKAANYFLGFAADGFVTIPLEGSTFPEDPTDAKSMLDLFHYRFCESVALLQQDFPANYWNSAFYLGVWTTSVKNMAGAGAIFPRAMFLEREDFDFDFYRDVRLRLNADKEKMRGRVNKW